MTDNLSDDFSTTAQNSTPGVAHQSALPDSGHLRGMFRSWYLDYASYVILERAVPHLDDGLKPVQRRILHSMQTLDDGRFNKVANIVGNTMLGQKELLVDTQGNWGNILTGASAAAGRYIEARLSAFALETLFSPKVTEWTPSYDGRKKEPVVLPAKFPLLLFQGVEGIAVGLSSKILPHNFNEILDAAIAFLRDEPFSLFPDFPTGGLLDISRYNDGMRGGAVKIRAKIEKIDSKTLAVTEIPFGKTTGTIIDSILKAFEKGKIKIRKVDDNTAQEARILVHLQPGTSSDKTIDALYAFTDCEVSVSPNCCVISDRKPHFLSVSDVLRHNVNRTRELLAGELRIRLDELAAQLHFASLERIFIEERIYKDPEFEQAPSQRHADAHILKRLEPYKDMLIRPITPDDLQRLMEIKMARILRFNSEKAEAAIAAIKAEMAKIEKNLAAITEYTIKWFADLKKKYGDRFPRRTTLRSFDNIEAATVAERNERLYFNRSEGFIGTALKKDEFICNCSSLDDIIIFYRDGRYKIVKVAEKIFVDKNVIHVNVFKRNDSRTVYNVIYQNGKGGTYYMKRFAVTGVSRDKEYNLTPGLPGTRIAWFTANPNGEAEIVKVTLKPKPKLKVLQFDVDFSQMGIKNRASQGNIVTRNEVHRFSLKEKGASTLGGRKVWFDPDVLRLNYDERGTCLGEFMGQDKILVILKSGEYYLTDFSTEHHYEDNILVIQKYNPDTVWTAILDDADQGYTYIKRFIFEPTARPQRYLGDNPDSSLRLLSSTQGARFRVTLGGGDSFREPLVIDAWDFIGVKSSKARGKRLTTFTIESITEIDPRPVDDDEIPDDTDQPQEIIVEDAIEDNTSHQTSDEEVRDEINGQTRIF